MTDDIVPEGASLRLRVEGMDCASCAVKIQTALGQLGYANVDVNVAAGSVVVSGTANLNARSIENTIVKLGYGVKPTERNAIADDHLEEDTGALWQNAKGRLAIASGILLVAAYVASLLVPSLGHWPFVVAALVALVPVARRALAAAQAGVIFTIEMLMTIATIGAIAIGAAEEAAVVVFLFAIGEMLEGVAASRARRSISALSALSPKAARVIEGGVTTEIAAVDLRPGQVVIVRPGDRVPCDGRIVDGQSSIDESPVNGESIPRPKGMGDDVFAGTVNVEAALQIEVRGTPTTLISARNLSGCRGLVES